MSSQLVLMGPSAAGKTSLMLGLSHLDTDHDFTVNRTLTTQTRRVNESDEEKIFVTDEEFESHRPNLLFAFRTYPTYEYGIPKQSPLAPDEVRMRVLPPLFAVKFRLMVEQPTLLCSIAPYTDDPESIIQSRDPSIEPRDLHNRLQRFRRDQDEADDLADIRFKNIEGLDQAVQQLASEISGYTSTHSS